MYLNFVMDSPDSYSPGDFRSVTLRAAGCIAAGLIIFLSGLFVGATLSWGQTAEIPPNETEVSRKQLLNAAYNSLWRLQRAIEKDGFTSARVALNVWRSNALDAGIFKQSQYDEFKQQIYEKSIQSSLTCIDNTIADENFNDAKRCLHTWKIHSEEIGTFDAQRYEELQKRIEDKSKEAAEKKVDE